MKKVIVMFSGGIDSTLCLALAVEKYGKEKVLAITFDYGQKNKKELSSASELANYYGVENIIVNLKNIFNSTKCALIENSNINIPIDTYDEQKKKSDKTATNVPFRNGIFLSVCAGIAIDKDIDTIYYGIHREEGAAVDFYPDCSEEFNLAMNNAIYIGSGKKVKIEAPLCLKSKKEIINLGIKYKLPFEKTWTCYEGGNIPCGKCCACQDRIKAFKLNKQEDPTISRKE